jgi:PIN domain nuclease of toxin-antitoxin system
MNYLVDAHTLVWALDSPDKLSTNAVMVLENLERH